ncbi:MAG: HAMP domain-containing histidine kinase [Desulfobacterales bacterium]|nr:MAG: HAMP domain-containing histidine kinase [Desulfobacterales bacterium]
MKRPADLNDPKKGGRDGSKPIRYSIRLKIFIVSLLPTLALLAAALLNHQYLSSLGESADQILSQNYKSIRAAQQARKMLEETRNQLLEQMSLRQKPALTPDEILKNLSDPLLVCRDNITESGEQELTELLLKDYGRYEKVVRSFSKADVGLWANERFAEFLTLTADMVARFDDLVAINEEAMESAEQKTRQLASRAQRNAVVLFTIVIVVILALSYFLSYRIAKPMMTLARSLSNAKEGSGIYPQINQQSNDEIGFLTDSFNRLFNRLELYDRHRDDIIASEKEKVRRSEEAKGRFIADISHQLKTPMTSLAMSIGLLHDRGERLTGEKRSKLLETAQQDCMRLSSLINELVDISRLEAMSRPRPKETLDVAVVIRECLAPLLKQAEQKGVTLQIEVPEGLPKLTIDSFRFPWVITNLVGNALRYTDSGGRIQLSANKSGSRFYFKCSDTGSGIAPHYLPHIFDRFTQFSERGKSGTIGLGLAIVKDIIEQHGGDIRVESSPGKGTTFVFWIPAEEDENYEKNIDR